MRDNWAVAGLFCEIIQGGEKKVTLQKIIRKHIQEELQTDIFPEIHKR